MFIRFAVAVLAFLAALQPAISHPEKKGDKAAAVAITFATQGDIGPVTFTFDLQNLDKRTNYRAIVYGPDERAPQRGTPVARLDRTKLASAAPLSAGGRARLQATATVGRAAKQIVPFKIALISERGVVSKVQPHAVYLKAENGRYSASTYERLYMPGRSAEAVNSAKTPFMTPARAMGPNQRIRPVEFAPDSGLRLDRNGGVPAFILPSGSGRSRINGDPPLPRDGFLIKPSAPVRADIVSDLLKFANAMGDPKTYTLSGSVAYLALNNDTKAALGWTVRAVWLPPGYKPNNLAPPPKPWEDMPWKPGWGQKSVYDAPIVLGEALVNGLGKWSMDVKFPGFAGQNVSIEYYAKSPYIRALGPDNQPFGWFDAPVAGIGTSYDHGNRLIDLSASTGLLPGLGDVYREAQIFRIVLTAWGFDPKRSAPIDLYFPNSWFDCGSSDKKPWSCASRGGTVWLIAEHNDATTILHELSHQLDAKFWNGALPPGAAIDHSLDQCYNGELAISEGFANALPFFVNGEFGVSSPAMDGGFEIETPDKTSICNGATNETWVASTFWDLADKAPDGKDTLYFSPPALVVGAYLNGGVKNDFYSMFTTYANLAKPEHKKFVYQVYEENTLLDGLKGLGK
jgi:hypothetical protein